MIVFISLLDLLGVDPGAIVDRLAQWNINVSVGLVSRVLDIVFLLVVFIIIWTSWKGLTYKRRKYIREKIGAVYDKRFNSREARWLFVDTCYLDKPLDSFDNPDAVLKEKGRNLVREFSKRVFANDNADTLHLVLGGSGMGKSSFLVALLRRYVMRHPWLREFEIELVDLGHKDCISIINGIQDKASTILLLDALDENREASTNCESFMVKLESCIRVFPITVITCRTQFFPSYTEELNTASILGNGKYKERLKYHHYYIRYFSDTDVRWYLLKKYPLNPFKLIRAWKAVSLCNSLEHRPLLLSYIDDLLKEKTSHLKNELDLYECLIELWIKREKESFELLGVEDVVQQLKAFSRNLASKMYDDYYTKNDYYVTGDEANDILVNMNVKSDLVSFKSRSLVERDSDGNFKFAHRTFLEFFLAQKAFVEDNVPIAFNGLNMTQLFFAQMCHRHIQEQVEMKSIVLGKSEPIMSVRNQLDIQTSKKGLKLKSLLVMPEITVLSFDYRDLPYVLSYIDGTSVRYLRLTGYRKGESLNSILDHSGVKYLWVDGGECSKAFLKRAQRQGVSVMLNGELILYWENDDCPMDFMAAAALPAKDTSPSLILDYLDLSDQYE